MIVALLFIALAVVLAWTLAPLRAPRYLPRHVRRQDTTDTVIFPAIPFQRDPHTGLYV